MSSLRARFGMPSSRAELVHGLTARALPELPPNGPHVLSLFDDPPTAAAHEPRGPDRRASREPDRAPRPRLGHQLGAVRVIDLEELRRGRPGSLPPNAAFTGGRVAEAGPCGRRPPAVHPGRGFSPLPKTVLAQRRSGWGCRPRHHAPMLTPPTLSPASTEPALSLNHGQHPDDGGPGPGHPEPRPRAPHARGPTATTHRARPSAQDDRPHVLGLLAASPVGPAAD